MEYDLSLLAKCKKLMIARFPRFATQIENANLQYKDNLPYHTAGTDGKNIYFDPNYLASLSDEDKLFLIAHELMHIKFEHMYRMTDKNGQMRDIKLWNMATDAIINANLERDGFKIQEGSVNMPEALNYNAEEFYEKLLQEKEQQNEHANVSDKSIGSQDNQNAGGDNSLDEKNANSQRFCGEHSLWEEAFKQMQKGEKPSKQDNEQNDSQSQESKQKELPKNKENTFDAHNIVKGNVNKRVDFDNAEFDKNSKYNEKNEFAENRKQRKEIARQKLKEIQEQGLKSTQNDKIQLGELGESKSILDWRLLLRREIEKTETIWSNRRSIAENNYAYRLEENDIEGEALTEVMIDVSGSVSLEMIKAFLRQLKPLLKESKLKVGCFNERIWGMVDIKSNRDIDNFSIPVDARGRYAWTEDWDLAVRSFTKRREVNKIVFTDGVPAPGVMPKTDLKGVNVLWIVYKNKDFAPCCGKVIQISPKDLSNRAQMIKTKDGAERSI